MIPYQHNAFSFRGFYDSGPHVVIFPYARPYEVVAHEATHGTIATLSSFGFLHQLAAYLRHFGDTCGCELATKRGNDIDAMLQPSSVLVHEATAWLVTILAHRLADVLPFKPMGKVDPNDKFGVPGEYVGEINRLRSSLEAIPGKGFDKLEESLNDHDPLFLTPSLLAISLASFALSPPFVKELLATPGPDFEIRLRAGIATPRGNPRARFHELQDRIRSTDFVAADKWSKWVKRWMYGKPEQCPVELTKTNGSQAPVDGDHSGYVRAQTRPEGLMSLVIALSGAQIPASTFAGVDWKAMAERFTFEPHVVSHFQTCITARPKLIQDFYVKDPVPGQEITRLFRFVNVSIGEEGSFRFNRFGGQKINLSFGPSPDEKKQLVWKTDVNNAKSFLRDWSAQGKGIVTASVDYDLSRGDLLDRDILKDLPHVVVAVTDLRTLWLRMTDEQRGGFKRARRIKVALVSCSEAPELYAYLVFKSDASFPLVLIPVLLQSGQYIHSIIEELMTPGYSLEQVAQPDLKGFVGVAEPSLAAAFHWLDGYFVG